MTSTIIIGLIISFLLLAFVSKFCLDWIYRRKFDNYRAKMSSLLALNISHLHDAANFFSLIKNQTQEKGAGTLARGASFHFRSIFDELRKSSIMLDNEELEGLALLYQKEVIDLKDLLELELLQLGHANRIEIENTVGAEHALIEGNFSLLSKIVLNLVENALKYTDKQVKIKLSDEAGKWQIRVSSFGKSIPEELAREINSSISLGTGHGLSSLQDVMQFHDASLAIDTLAGEGSSIRLVFDKYSKNSLAESPSTKDGSGASLTTQVLVICSLFVVVSMLVFTINYNKQICKDYKKQLEAKYQDDELELKQGRCLEALAEMQESFSFDDTEQLQKTKTQFLSNFAQEDRELVNLILFREIMTKAPFSYKALVDQEAKSLLVEFPDSTMLNLYLSDFYFTKQYYGRMMIHSLKTVLAILQEKLFLHPDIYSVKASVPVELLAQLYAEPIEKFQDQELIAAPAEPFVPVEAKQNHELLAPELPDDTVDQAELLELDDLINEQDKELGLDLEDF